MNSTLKEPSTAQSLLTGGPPNQTLKVDITLNTGTVETADGFVNFLNISPHNPQLVTFDDAGNAVINFAVVRTVLMNVTFAEFTAFGFAAPNVISHTWDFEAEDSNGNGLIDGADLQLLEAVLRP